MAGGRRAPGSHACPSASLDQGLFHSKRGSEQNQPPAIPPPLCLAWGLTFHTQWLRAWPWEPACLGAHPWPHHSPAGQVPALLGALPASPAKGRQGHLPRAGYVSQSALRSTGPGPDWVGLIFTHSWEWGSWHVQARPHSGTRCFVTVLLSGQQRQEKKRGHCKTPS